MSIAPTITVELALDDGPFVDAPTWTDISDLVRSLNVQRGRTNELETHSAGTCTLTLDNSDGRFDPQNPSGPYYGKLLFNRRVRITATIQVETTAVYSRSDGRDYTVTLISGETYPVFYGFVDSWPSIGDTTREYNEVQLVATDLFRLLAERRIEAARAWTVADATLGILDDPTVQIGGYPVPFEEECTGQRVEKILQLLAVPEALRDIDRGLTVCVADSPTDKALEYMQRLERTEGGRLFVAADGRVTFRERRAWTRSAAQRTPQATFSDDPGPADLTYVDGTFDPGSPGRVRNVIVRGRDDREIRAVDSDSVDTYGPLEDAQTNLLTARLEELRDHAGYQLARLKDALPQWQQVTVVSTADPDRMLPQQLGRELGQQITIVRTAQDGTPVSGAYWIDRIEHNVTRYGEWVTTWTVTAADTRTFWTVGDATLGILDDPAVVLAW